MQIVVLANMAEQIVEHVIRLILCKLVNTAGKALIYKETYKQSDFISIRILTGD